MTMGAYLRRLAVTTGISAVLGVLGCIGYGLWERLALITEEFTVSLWPMIPVTILVLIFGSLNIRGQIRKLLSKGMVENIRELG